MQDEYLKLFLLNDKYITLSELETAGYSYCHVLLDFIRYNQNLTGTKIGCREGDCGACTVLVGKIDENGEINYRSIVSCLTPIGNVIGSHVVTIEGINLHKKLTIVQETLANEGGTQCGACTPGFIVSLTNLLLLNSKSPQLNVNTALDGNICRCTGYKSIERAAEKLLEVVNYNALSLKDAIEKNILPPYFSEIKSELKLLGNELEGLRAKTQKPTILVGGGTDLYVQKPDSMLEHNLSLLSVKTNLSYVKRVGHKIHIGSGTTFSEITESEDLQNLFPRLNEYFSLIASTPIRNIATLGGNIVNASPIADTVIFFLVLNSQLTIQNGSNRRTVDLVDFYRDYKEIDLENNDVIIELIFEIPKEGSQFNFEKVSKRTYLDIASVNSAILINLDDNGIVEYAKISSGGVAPIPKYLDKGSKYLTNKPLNNSTIRKLLTIIDEEITPISDIRGSAEYKRLLLRQLVIAHFYTLFPNILELEEIIR